MKIYKDGHIEECDYYFPSTPSYELFCDEKECKNCMLYRFFKTGPLSSNYIEMKNGMGLYLGDEE